MKISAIQKLTLLDYPGRMACTVFTPGCNFRCPFCHNALLVLPEMQQGDELSCEEVLSFLKKRTGILEGICLTGGEPLLQSGVDDFLRRVKDLGYAVKLDTNGSFPDRLEALISAGLVDKVAMDIKNSPELYALTVGLPAFDIAPVERSKELLLSGVVDYEFRTTVVKGIHTAQSLTEAAKWIRGAKDYYLQQFKDSGNLIDSAGLSAYSEEEMKAFSEAIRPYVANVHLRGI